MCLNPEKPVGANVLTNIMRRGSIVMMAVASALALLAGIVTNVHKHFSEPQPFKAPI